MTRPCVDAEATRQAHPRRQNAAGCRRKCAEGRAAVPEGGRKDFVGVELVSARSVIHAVGSGDDVVTADYRRRT